MSLFSADAPALRLLSRLRGLCPLARRQTLSPTLPRSLVAPYTNGSPHTWLPTLFTPDFPRPRGVAGADAAWLSATPRPTATRLFYYSAASLVLPSLRAPFRGCRSARRRLSRRPAPAFAPNAGLYGSGGPAPPSSPSLLSTFAPPLGRGGYGRAVLPLQGTVFVGWRFRGFTGGCVANAPPVLRGCKNHSAVAT